MSNQFVSTATDTIPDPTIFRAVMAKNDKDTLFKVWDRGYGGTQDDSPAHMIKTDDGNYFLLGNSASGNTGNKTSINADDYWLIKIDASGNKLWEKTFGGNSTDYAKKILACPNNEYILIGRSASGQGRDKTENLIGGWDVWLVKIDENGNKIWDKTIGTDENDEMFDAVVLSDGSIVLTGNKMPLNYSNDDIQVIKLNASGNVVWQKFFTGDLYDESRAIATTSDNGFLLLGSSNSSVANNKSAPSKGEYDYWLLKINENGEKVWDKTFGGSLGESGNKILKTTDNYYYLIGNSLSEASGDKSALRYGSYDIWIIKINESGEKIWDRAYGGTDLEQFETGIVLSDNNILIGCLTYSDNNGVITEPVINSNSFSGGDIWMAKISSNGDIIWNKRAGGGQRDIMGDFYSINEDEVFVYARSNSGVGADKTAPLPENCTFNCSDDIWLMKYKLKNKILSPVSISPSQTINLFAINCQGNVTWSNNSSGFSINVSPSQTTTYTATCHTNETTTTSSIIVNVNLCGDIVDLTVTDPITTGTSANPITKMADNKITATNAIGSPSTNASAKYVAGKSIILNPGFKIETGSIFQTRVSPGCN